MAQVLGVARVNGATSEPAGARTYAYGSVGRSLTGDLRIYSFFTHQFRVSLIIQFLDRECGQQSVPYFVNPFVNSRSTVVKSKVRL